MKIHSYIYAVYAYMQFVIVPLAHAKFFSDIKYYFMLQMFTDSLTTVKKNRKL